MRAGELRFAVGASHAQERVHVRAGRDERSTSRSSSNPMSIFASNNTAGETKVQGDLRRAAGPRDEQARSRVRLSRTRTTPTRTSAPRTRTKALFTFRATDEFCAARRLSRAPSVRANTAELFQGVSLLVVPFAPSDPCSFTTTVPWGNIAPTTRTASRCRAVRDDHQQQRHNPVERRYVGVRSAGQRASERLCAAGRPVLPARDRAARRQPERPARGGRKRARSASCSRAQAVSRTSRRRSTIYNIEITDAIAPLNSLFVYAAVLQRRRRQQSDAVLQRPGWLLQDDRPQRDHG